MSADPTAPTERFGNRAEDYLRWRPGYPPQLVPWLVERCRLQPGAPVADIGAGTGLLTRDLVAAGLQVQAVEPNAAMRDAGTRSLGPAVAAVFRDGSAEATGLPGRSIALITAAQAFHWFQPQAAKAEFARILQHRGHVALIWNVRRDDSPFLAGYEALLREHAPEYARSGVPAQADEAVIGAFFAPYGWERRDFEYVQHFDREGLRGRLLSSSYAPARGEPGYAPMIAALDALFAAHEREGRVAFAYRTQAYLSAWEASG
jgi:SAM-dependent methyltransferase